jgi:hypothetical protein
LFHPHLHPPATGALQHPCCALHLH